jgi:hypothetical protein
MLVTHHVKEMHARPMVIARLDKEMDVYLLTDSNSVKVHEISENPHATLTFQGTRQFVSMKGEVVVVHDKALLETMWKEAWKVWFPLGKTDPNIAILKFTAHEGEFWDNAGMQGLKFVYGAAKAYLTGERPKPDSAQHDKVTL